MKKEIKNILSFSERKFFENFSKVEIKSHRKGDSYKYLLSKRNYAIKPIVDKYKKIPDRFLNQRKCPNCFFSKYKILFVKDYFKISQCIKCQTVYVPMIFNKNFYNEIYNNSVYHKITKKLSDRSHEYRVVRFGNERIQRLQKYIKKKKIKHLDIGCGTGFVVESAKKKGWDSTGIDLNKSGIDFGKKRNLKLFNCDLDYFIKNINSKKKYDVITLFDVLEHIVDPKELIYKIKSILEKNGLIYSYVPNFNSASKILFGEKAHFIWPSHHLTYWTPETIVNFFKNLNLKTIFLETEGLDIEDFLFHYGNSKKIDIIKKYKNEFQFFINAGLYGKNLRIIVSNNKN